MFHHLNRFWSLIVLAVIAIGSLTVWVTVEAQPVLHTETPSLTPQDVVSEAWQMAIASGDYEYDTTIEHTQYPAPKLSNSGRQPTTDFLAIAGRVDQAQDLMEMTLWQDAGRNPERGVTVKVENGQTLGRVGHNEWEEMDNIADLFAPDQDPLGFLAFATNVEHHGRETRQLGNLTLSYERYTFALDSEAYAAQKSRQMTEHLRQYGKLPPALSLNSAEIYRRAVGVGELWLDADGLPVRLTLDLDIPAYRDNGRTVSKITTDLYGLEHTAVETTPTTATTFWQSPQTWLTTHQATIITTVQKAALALFILLTSSFILLLVTRYWHTPTFYKTIAYLIVFALVAPPLLEARQIYAFTKNFHEAQLEEQAEMAEAEELEAARAQLRASDWNPTQNPLESPQIKAEARLNKTVQNDLLNITANTTIDTSDSDGDGLTDTDEAYWQSCAYPLNSTEYNNSSDCSGVADPTDSDGDSFSDYVEVYDLGSFPNADDSDGDGLSDTLEITGFSYNGQTWYSDYNEADSNKDGLTDGAECLVWYEASAIYDPSAICPDTDGDGTPDLFDEDNDGDNVPDGQDLSPNSHGDQTFTKDNPFYFSAANLEADKPVMLNIHLRPTWDSNLNLYNHVLDWPTNDTEGQITRYLDTTWADTDNSAYQSDDDNAANGDIRLTPMLEITMPYQEGHYSNLPITTTAPASRVADAELDTWLDESQLDPFSITISDAGENAGDLLAYIPLTAVADDYDSTVSFGAQMVYRPNTAVWGNAHEIRVVWLVQMLTDECIDEDDDPDTCDRQDTMTVIHTYDESWTLTGLNVTEEHGLDAAIVYEDYDASRPLEAQLWTASWNLSNSFLRGRDCEVVSGNSCGATDGVRDVTVANLDSTINDWFSGENYLNVETFSYDHQAYIGYMVSNQLTQVLDDNYTATAAEYNPTIMIVQEYETRDLNLDNYDAAFTNAVTFDLDPNEVVKQLYGTISWSPYTYVGGEWTGYDVESYLDLLSAQLSTDDFFTPEDDSDESYYEAEGKLVWAQMYYASLVQGATALIELDGASIFVESLEENLLETDFYERLTPPGSLTGAGYIGAAFATALLSSFGSGSFFKTLGKTFISNTAPYSLTYNRQLSGMQIVKINAVSLMVLSLAVMGTALIAYGYLSGDSGAFQVGVKILSLVTIVVVSVYALNAIRAMTTAAKTVTGFFATAGAVTKAAKAFPAMGAIGFAITLGFAWGMFIYQATQTSSSIELQMALAYAIAQTIIALVLLALDLIGLGIFTMILAIIDAILALFGETTATEWLTEVIAEFLYDVNLVITNIDSSDRLAVGLDSLSLADDSLGFTGNNSLVYTYTVTNTAKYGSEYDFETAANRNVFIYTLQDSENDYHEGLNRGDQDEVWLNLGDRKMRLGDTQAITISMASMGVGLNRSVSFYLTESYYISYEGCWFVDGMEIYIAGIKVAEVDACSWESVSDSTHIDLGESQVYDILPNTVQAFARMDWDDSFAQQIDIDADGLPYNDGTDPDYRYFDYDEDGLSDMYEVSNGYNAEQADADNDGLTDREELIYYTNPFMSDTDEDGLNDYIEVKEGWFIVYDGNQLARVWSDPNVADADEDGLDDLDEFLFGFNPWVATDPSIIETLVEFDDLTVDEETNLQLLLRMEENSDAQIFSDSSGNRHEASCDSASSSCPTAEVTGRYGNGLLFDGNNDHLETDFTLNPAETGFTAVLWFNPTAFDTGTYQRLISQEADDGSDTTWLGFESTGWYYTLVGGTYMSAGTHATAGEWQHGAVTYDGETITIYLNGVAMNATTITAAASTKPIRISTDGNSDNFYFNGAMDEIAVFDRALTQTEIEDVMHGRYNPNDLYAAPGTELSYRATITNSTSTNASGFLVAETGYIDPELPEATLALSFEEEQRLAYFENSVSVDDTPLSCTFAEDSCPRTGIEGVINSSVLFDGVNDYLTLPGFIGQYNRGYSIFFWMYVDNLPEPGEIAMILDSEDTADGTLDIYLNSDGKLVAESAGMGTVQTSYNFGNNLNTFVHVGFVSDRFYINSSSNGGYFDSENQPRRVSAGRLGNSVDGTAPFHGRIDELVLYNTSVTDSSEISSIRSGSYNVDIVQARYDFDELTEFSGTTFYNNISSGVYGECTQPACPTLTEDGEGYTGRGVLFDGVDDSIYQAGNTISADEGDYTFYIKPLSYPAAGEVAYIYDTIGNGRDENYSFNLYMDENGQISYDGDDEFQTFDTVIPLGEWSKIRFWYDDNTTRYDAYLSVNDNRDSQQVSICSGTSTTCRDESQFIGRGYIGNNNAQNSPFHGYIDEISIGIAEYDFDPPVSSIGYENVANDLRTATCSNVFLCASVTEGKYGDGVYFDGTDDFLNLGNILDSTTTNFTVGLWFNMDELTYYHRILQQADGSGDGRVWLGITDTGQLYTYLGSSYIGGGTPTIGQWHYATVTYDGTTLSLYMDGVLMNSAADTPIFSDGDVLLGIHPEYRLAFSGSMDELIILSEAADTDQIAFLMESTYPALETANQFETYTAAPISSTAVSGSATIAENLPTSRYQFDLEVEAALELQTQIDFPVIDDNSANLSAYFPFEDTPGSTYFDNLIPYEGFYDVMYDVEGECFGNSCPTAGVRGLIGRAASFDGQDDFLLIDLDDEDNYDGYSGRPDVFSASVWVKGKKGTIFDTTDTVFADSGVRIDFGRVYQYEENNNRISATYATPFDIPIDEWTHIALTINDSTDEGIVYINGQQVATGTHFTSEDSDFITIGANYGQQNYFEGVMDDLRLYDVTLTAADVLALYEESAPVLRFEFDEDDTATAFYDETPNGYVGYPLATTAFNDTLGETVTTLNPTPGTDGKIGNTALFDGNGYIEVPNAADSIDFTQDFTILTWMKTSAGNTGIVAKTDDDTAWESGEKVFYIDPDGTPRFVGYGNNYIVGDTAVTDDIWRHVAVVWDRDESGTTGTGTIYIDGEDATASSNYRANNADRAADTLRLGYPNFGEADNYFDGQLDELALYGRALTEAEINGIFLQEYRWYRANSYNELQVDVEAPVIEYLSDATYRAEGYIQLSVATRDTHSYINTFDFGLKGPNDSDFSWQSAPICGEATTTGSAWCPYFDTADYGGEGLYEVKFRAVDAVGNETTSAAYTLYVDGQAPTTSDSFAQAINLTPVGTRTLAWSVSLNGNVYDPEITSGLAGSGLVSNTMQFGLFDTSGGLIQDGWQTVTLSGNAWSIDYQLSGARPSGTYTAKLAVEDEVGNSDTLTIGTLTFDERAPTAKVNEWELPGELITETATLTGIVVEQPDWGDALAEYHFETDASATTFYDSSGNSYHATCTGAGDCPTADTSGTFGQALLFDGTDDVLVISDTTPDLSESSFTVSAWVKHTDNGDWRNVIGQKNTGGNAQGWVLRLNNDNTAALFAANGSSRWDAVSSSAIPENEWHHLAATIDRDAGEIKLYVDGALVDTVTGLTGSLGTPTLVLGRWSVNNGDYFSGAMDEVYLYERALSESEIYALAQNEVQGVSSVELLVEEQDFSGNAVTNIGTWQPATVTNGSWSYTLPTNVEGSYEVSLRSTDNYGNTAVEGVIWRGTIDDIAPRITASGQHIGGTNAAQTEYSFVFEDFILDTLTFDQPCQITELDALVYDDETLPQNSAAYQVSATCVVDGHEASRDFTACDMLGNCATLTVNPTVAAVGTVTISSPSNLSVFTENETINFTGAAYDPTAIDSITLYANGVAVDTAVYSGNDTIWNASWTPTIANTYDIDAVMVGSSGTYTDSITVAVIEGTAHSLPMTATLQGRSDHTAVYTVTAYTTNNITPTWSMTTTANISGNLTVSGFTPGTYTVTLQTGSYLMAVETVTITGSGDTADFGELLAGDANADNTVNILDLSMLASAYNASDGDGSFNPAADFNGDGVVNVLDLSLLAGNYNMTGERP